MIIITIGLALGVSAQKVVGRGGYHTVRPRVSVGVGWGYSPFYSPWYSPFTIPGITRPMGITMAIDHPGWTEQYRT